MRRALFILTFLAGSASLSRAQQLTYSVLENDPTKAYSKFVAPEWGGEFSGSNLSIFLGANGRYGITDKLTLEGIARYDLFQMKGKGAAYLLEGGIFLPLKTSTKVKEVPVVLSYNPYAGTTYQNGRQYNIESTKYISIPNGEYLNKLGVRGGIYHRMTGVEGDDIKAPGIPSTATLVGVYVGLQQSSQAYVKTKINNEVERIGAGFARYYGDIVIYPVSSIGDETIAPALKKDKTVGWRVGLQWYLDPHDGDYKRLMNSIFTTELGSRPYTGFYINFSWGFAFLNSR